MSHIIANLIASYLDPHLCSMIIGIVIGGIVPLLFIPFLEKIIKNKSQHHIISRDHEGVKIS